MTDNERILKKINNIKIRTRTERVLLLIILVGIAIIAMLVIDMRCSKELSNTQIVYADQEEVTKAPTISTGERNLIERVVAAEARGESLETQMAVAEVIKSRSESWNKSITEVLTANRQFAKPFQGEISELTKDAVRRVFDNGETIFGNEPTHFFSGPDPYWLESKQCIGMVGSLKFCK